MKSTPETRLIVPGRKPGSGKRSSPEAVAKAKPVRGIEHPPFNWGIAVPDGGPHPQYVDAHF